MGYEVKVDYSKETELGNYKGWKIQCVAKGNKVFYMAYLLLDEAKMPMMKNNKNLEDLKKSIDEFSVKRGQSRIWSER